MGSAADAGKLGIDEFDVEAGIVDHQRRVAQKFQEFLRHMGEQRLVGQKFRRQAVHPLGLDGDVALGVQIELQGAAGGEMIHQLDAADLDDAMTVAGSNPVVSVSKTISRIAICSARRQMIIFTCSRA